MTSSCAVDEEAFALALSISLRCFGENQYAENGADQLVETLAPAAVKRICGAPHTSLAFMFWGAGLFVFPLMLIYAAVNYCVVRGNARATSKRY